MNWTYRIGLLIVLVALLVPGAVLAQQHMIRTSLSDNRIRASQQDRPGALWIDMMGSGPNPWWNAWWAYVLYALIAIGAISGSVAWQLRTVAVQRHRLESQVAERTHALGERVKELNCLYGISSLVVKPGISLDEILQGTLELIPPSWQYPEITCVRISLDESVFATENYAESPWKQAAGITVHDEQRGVVEVLYLQEKPLVGEGPFLQEERNLIDAIAAQLGKAAESLAAEAKALSQNQFLQTVLDSLAHPFYVIDARDRRVVMANAAAQPGHLIGGITCHALIHGNDHPCEAIGYKCTLVEILNTSRPVVIEHSHLDRFGEQRYVEVHGFPILGPSGEVVQIIEYSLDVTDRKQAKLALEVSETRWRSLTETSPDHILTLDTDLNITFANHASPGLTVEELIGTPLYIYVDDERQAEVKSILERAVEAGAPVNYETVYYVPDGDDIYYDSQVSPRFHPESNDVIGLTISSRNITERKQVQVQRLRLAALEERERIGRELHDDLGQVIGYICVQIQAAQNLLAQDQTAKLQATLKQLHHVAQEAHSDVRQYILGFRTSAHSPTGFFATLNQYVDNFRERYGVEVELSWPEDVLESPLAHNVETQLLRVIQEALTNVGLHADVDTARILFTLHEDSLQAVIEDEGSGFSFPLTATTSGGDNGHFGLQIMRERIESVDGSLAVRSAPGKGTRVIVQVPCTLKDSDRAEFGHGVRILLVDDHPLYLEGLRSLLASRGLQVVGVACDGLTGLELARRLRPDLVLMDIRMPGLDGIDATRRITTELPETKVVMLTTVADDDALFAALKNGASGYLLKNLDGARFFALLSQVLAGETVLSPSLAFRVLAEFAHRTDETDAHEEPALTARQIEVLELIAKGSGNKEIADRLTITERTVKYHVSGILERLQLRSRHQLARYAREHGLVEHRED